MKKLESTPREVICENPQSVFGYFAWPTIARLPDGTLALGASGFRVGHICPFGKVVMSYSRDEGKTWTPPTPVIDTLLDDRDCGVTVFGKDKKRVIVTSFNNTPHQQKEWNNERLKAENLTDAKKTLYAMIDAYVEYVKTQPWEQYLGSTYRISEDGGYTFGPLKHIPVSAPHGPCALNDGGLMYVGRKYKTKDVLGDTEEVQAWVLNDKDEWEYLSSIESVEDEFGPILSCEPHSIQLPSGRIVVHIRSEREDGSPDHWAFSVYQSVSDDGGKTWTKPVPLMGMNDGSPPHLMLHSSGALICVYGRRKAPYGIRAMISYDEGETWDTDYILADDSPSPDLGYPATVELEDGSLLTVWYENIHGRYENIGGRSLIVQKKWTLPKR